MASSLIKYLGDIPTFTVIRALLLSSKPRHIRDLARQYSISPAGVSDIIRRLQGLGILKESRVANRRCFSLEIPEEERRCLNEFFAMHQIACLRERALLLNKSALKKFCWIDEVRDSYRVIKRARK